VGQCVINIALNHDAIESLPLSCRCHEQTDQGRVVDITSIPTTCCGEIFFVHNVKIARVTLTTPTSGTLTHHKTKRLHMADPCTKFEVSGRLPPGRPRSKWLDQLRNDSTRPIGDLWRLAVGLGHCGATTRRPSPATRP